MHGSGFKLILHCTFHSENFEKCWFRLTVLVLMSLIAKDKEVPPVKGFGLECNTFDKSFMYIKKMKVPILISVEPHHLRLFTLRNGHLKLLFFDNFSKYVFCVVLVLTYISVHLVPPYQKLLICQEIHPLLLSQYEKE